MNNKMTILGAAFMMTVASFTFTSCGEAENNSHDDDKNVKVEETTKKEAEVKVAEPEHAHAHAADFQCPMECEGDKTYADAGACPVCKMDLKELKHDHTEETEHGDDHGDHEHGDDHGDHEHGDDHGHDH
jgi:hypothetical protein